MIDDTHPATAVADVRDMRTVTVNGTQPASSYPYLLGEGCGEQIAWELDALDPDRLVVLADELVWRLHGASLAPVRNAVETTIVPVPAGEQAKQVAVLDDVLARALDAGATRRTVIVTFGGGSTGNVGGLAAALLFRGVRLVHLPTTTIGAFDSVLSLKQAINSAIGKNQIGTYHRPTAVMVDIRWFDTLTPGAARGGWCEAAKNALAILPSSLDDLGRLVGEEDPRARWSGLFDLSLEAKMAVMADDPHERGAGLVLEYGHTVGHALEFASATSPSPLAHGDAIVLGMLAAAHVSHALGLLGAEDAALHTKAARAIGAPTRIPSDVDLAQVLRTVRRDNKRGLLDCDEDEVAMVLLDGLGRPHVRRDDGLPLVGVPERLVEAAVTALSPTAG